MFKNTTGKNTLVASVAALVLTLALVASQAAGEPAAAMTDRAAGSRGGRRLQAWASKQLGTMGGQPVRAAARSPAV